MGLHDDGGGVYTLSLQSDTRIEENVIINITRSPWADTSGKDYINGIFLDDHSKGIAVHRNVIDNLQGAMMQQIREQGNVSPGDNDIKDNGSELSSHEIESIKANAGLETKFLNIKDRIQ
jgi:hypothetical protein